MLQNPRPLGRVSFNKGVTFSFEKILATMSHKLFSSNHIDHSKLLRELDPKQRKALSLFEAADIITAPQLGKLFHFKARTNSLLAQRWVSQGFLEIVDFSKKGRRYTLAKKYRVLIS